MTCDICGEKFDEQDAREQDAMRRELLAVKAKDYATAAHWHQFRVNVLNRMLALVVNCGTRPWCKDV